MFGTKLDLFYDNIMIADDFEAELGSSGSSMSDFDMNQLLMSDPTIDVRHQDGVARFYTTLSIEQSDVIELVEQHVPPAIAQTSQCDQMNSTSFMSSTVNSAASTQTFKRPLPMDSVRNKRRSQKTRRKLSSSVSSINLSTSSNKSSNSSAHHDKHSMTLNSTIVSCVVDRWIEHESDTENVRGFSLI